MRTKNKVNASSDSGIVLGYLKLSTDSMMSRTAVRRKFNNWSNGRLDAALDVLIRTGKIVTAAIKKPGSHRVTTFYSLKPVGSTLNVKGVNVVRMDLAGPAAGKQTSPKTTSNEPPAPRAARLSPSVTNMPFLATVGRQLIERAKSRTTDNWDPKEVHIDLSEPEPKIFLVDAAGDYEQITDDHRVFATDDEFVRYQQLKARFEPAERQSR